MDTIEELNDPIKRVERIINSFVRSIEKAKKENDSVSKRLEYHLSRMRDALIILTAYQAGRDAFEKAQDWHRQGKTIVNEKRLDLFAEFFDRFTCPQRCETCPSADVAICHSVDSPKELIAYLKGG
jgi:hypothetical protein